MTRLLLVEDYPPLATVVAIALRRGTGHEVVRVGSVSRAEAALAERGVFDVAVLDIDLPDGSGVDLARRLIERGQVSACVFFTASRDEAERAAARQVGPVVDKLATMDELVQVVLTHLGASAEHAPKLREALRSAQGSDGDLTSGSGTRPRVR
ncbi:MAG: response regulator [Polyangiaceae bacterium]|nr:response regulator [Polyangiaceae bacterium]MCW5790635.1 response regulator [Polyangiaceae bacterium]